MAARKGEFHNTGHSKRWLYHLLQFLGIDPHWRKLRSVLNGERPMTTQPNADYKTMIEEIIRTGSDTILDNYSFDHAVVLSEAMFNHTEKYARILTGELAPDDNPTLRDSFTNMVRKLSKQTPPGIVRVITTRLPVLPDWLNELSTECSQTLRILLAKEKDKTKPVQHMFVMDSKMVRLEELHVEGDRDVKAKVCFNAATTAGRMEQSFDGTWEQLERQERVIAS